MIGLPEAADRLGVHYMTAYRYVRTGRLPAVRVGGEWQVDPDDVTGFRPRSHPGSAGTGPSGAVDDATGDRAGGGRPGRPARRTWGPARLEARLLAGDELGAWHVVESALGAGADPADIHLDLLAPALRSVGDRWQRGELDVADEHRASVVAHRLIGRLGVRFARPGRKRGTVLVAAVAGERHDIPVAMVADQLRGAGFAVVDLGADTPAASLAAAVGREPLVAVALGITGRGHGRSVADAVAAVRAAGPVPVLLGGAAVPDPAAAHRLGADGSTGPDARSVVAAVESLVPARARRRPSDPAAPRWAAPDASTPPPAATRRDGSGRPPPRRPARARPADPLDRSARS